jgi:hypothetical protein
MTFHFEFDCPIAMVAGAIALALLGWWLFCPWGIPRMCLGWIICHTWHRHRRYWWGSRCERCGRRV